MTGIWTEVLDVDGDVTDTFATIQNVPDVGLTYFRVGAFNIQGEIIQYQKMAVYCPDCGPPPLPSGPGIQ